MLILLMAMIFMHFLADFPLQGDFMASIKGSNMYVLFAHSFIWAGCISIPLMLCLNMAWWKFAFLLFGHMFFDYCKANKKDKTNALTKDLWLDQALHLAQLLIVI